MVGPSVEEIIQKQSCDKSKIKEAGQQKGVDEGLNYRGWKRLIFLVGQPFLE